jgi:hypothetical protein
LALRYASPKLQADKEVALAAVWQDVEALQYVAPEMRELVEAINRQKKEAFLSLFNRS